MKGEIPNLTPEAIVKAETLTDVSHPVLDLLDHHTSTLIETYQQYLAEKNSPDTFFARKFGWFADALVELSSFSLTPLDIISIWSKLDRLNFGGPTIPTPRYRAASVISAAFAAQGVMHPSWKRYPRSFLETHMLPEDVVNDKSGLVYVANRLGQVRSAVNEIYAYARSINSDPFQTSLGEIYENFGNGMITLLYPIQKALE